MIQVRVQGLDRATKTLFAMPRKLDAAIQDFLTRAIYTIEANAKKSPMMRVDTGRMRASVGGGSFRGGSFPKGEGIAVLHHTASIGPTVTYAPQVHKRYPFMTDALSKTAPQLKGLLKKSVLAQLS